MFETMASENAAVLVTVVSKFGEFGEVQRRSIRRFLDRADGASPYQDPAFCRSGGWAGGELGELYVLGERDGETVLFGRGIENFTLSRYLPSIRGLVLQKGPVAADLAALASGLRALKQACHAARLHEVQVQARVDAAAANRIAELYVASGFRPVSDAVPAMTLRLPVVAEPDRIFAGFSKKTRYELRRAARFGVAVRFAETAEDFSAFYEIYSRRGDRKGFTPISEHVFATIAERLRAAPERGALLLSEHDGNVLAGAVMMRAGPRVHYVYGATAAEQAGTLPAAYPIMWRAIEWARELGCTEMDFGGYGPRGEPEVQRFKEGFGGEVRSFAPPYVCNLSLAVMRLRGAARRLQSGLRVLDA